MEKPRKIVPPVYVLLSIIAMVLLNRYAPLARVIAPPYSYAGGVLLVLGIAIAIINATAFRRVGTPVVPFHQSTTLVTTGFYRYTRNPMYIGMVTGLLGIAILFGSASAFLPIPVFILIIQEWFIKGEERFLEEIFDHQYVDFKKRVRRWI
jgi:protein-S-isoprenylcysteine O-methyltransferase Ste14